MLIKVGKQAIYYPGAPRRYSSFWASRRLSSISCCCCFRRLFLSRMRSQNGSGHEPRTVHIRACIVKRDMSLEHILQPFRYVTSQESTCLKSSFILLQLLREQSGGPSQVAAWDKSSRCILIVLDRSSLLFWVFAGASISMATKVWRLLWVNRESRFAHMPEVTGS